MRFVGDDHDIAPVRQHREAVFILAGHEFLDSGEHNATRWPVGQLGAQVATGFRLHRLLAQQPLRQREHAEQLAIQIVAVGNHHNRRVFHRCFAHHARGKAGHGDALAAALGMPDHAAFVTAAGA